MIDDLFAWLFVIIVIAGVVCLIFDAGNLISRHLPSRADASHADEIAELLAQDAEKRSQTIEAPLVGQYAPWNQSKARKARR